MDNQIIKIGLPVALAIIMLGMGLGLSPRDFTRVFKHPKAFISGAVLQLICLPLVAIGIIFLMPMAAPFAVGLMILAACPGGTTSNLLTYVSRGDVALSVSLTAVISLVGFITIPLITAWALENFMGAEAPELPIAQTMIGVLAITTVPVAIGMLIRKVSARLADMAEKLFRPLSVLVFIAVVLAAIYIERANVIDYIFRTGVQVITLNLVMMIIAAMIANAVGLSISQRKAITLECGLQNSTIGLVIAITILGNTVISIPIAVYGLLMLFTGFGYALAVQGRTDNS